APEQIAPGDDFTDIGLDSTVVLRSRCFDGLQQQPGNEIQLYRETSAAMDNKARQKSGAGKKVVGLFNIAVDKDVFPRDENLIHDEDGIVFIQAAREWVVKWTSHYGG